jgi:23S rRNA pseudouridine955/2504/2580 synthase
MDSFGAGRKVRDSFPAGWYHISPMTESNPSAVRRLRIDEGDAGQRLDNYLCRILKGVPKSRIYRIVRKGEVRVNKGRVEVSYKLQAGDELRIPPVRVAEEGERPLVGAPLLQRLEAAILYEDERLLVLDKPSGLAVHGGSGVSLGVIEALRQMRPREKRIELVHRLDRDTSGCLLIAKRASALRELHELLRENRVDKRYLALAAGRLGRERIQVQAPLLKNTLKSGERMVRVDPEGKPAETHFLVKTRYAEATLVEARLLTGRTHQARVHLAHLGNPILGDDKYGQDAANQQARRQGLRRLFLHAESLAFPWPDGGSEGGRELRVRAPLPPELQTYLSKLQP